MSTPATATYFVKTFREGILTASGRESGTLVDSDLIRGDDFGERVLPQSDGIRGNLTGLFQGFTLFGQPTPTGRLETDGDILARVTFSDGTTLTGVRGVQDLSFDQFSADFAEFFLLETAALAAVGKTMADVVDVVRTSFTDNTLNWSDFGFAGTALPPAPPPPPPPPPPVLNVIQGTSGRDVLVGTAGDDLIIANGGNRDRLTGGEGEDTFVFGAQVGNGRRDIAVITDYNVDEDTILITGGAQVSRIVTSGDDVIIHLRGRDGDRIILEDAAGFGPLVKIEFDPDFIV